MALISLCVLVASIALAVGLGRFANPIWVRLEQPDFKMEVSYRPQREFALQLNVYGATSIGEPPYLQRKRDYIDEMEDADTRAHDVRLTTYQERQGTFSKSRVLSVTRIWVAFQRPSDIVLTMKSLEDAIFSAGCSSSIAGNAKQTTNRCLGNIAPAGSEVTLCAVHDIPMQITYSDSNGVSHSEAPSRFQCLELQTTRSLNILATDGFDNAHAHAYEVDLECNNALQLKPGDGGGKNRTQTSPILLRNKPVVFGERVVHRLEFVAGEESDGERSTVSWSLRAKPGTHNYVFTATSPNTSLLTADGEQMLQANPTHTLPNHLPYAEQEVAGQTREIEFLIKDTLRETTLSNITLSSSGLNNVAKIQFHGAFLAPALRHFSEQNEGQYDEHAVLRVCQLIQTYLVRKGHSNEDTRKLDPRQIRNLIFSHQRRKTISPQEKWTHLLEEIRTLDFETYIQQAANEEGDPEISKALTQMYSWLREHGEPVYQIPSITAAEEHPVVMGLHFPLGLVPGTYGGEIVISGSNFSAVRVPLVLEIYDARARSKLIVLGFITTAIGAITGALMSHWLKSRKVTIAGESTKPETKQAETEQAETKKPEAIQSGS